MIRVLLIDRSWPMIAQIARKFADLVQGSDIHVLFLSDKEPSVTNGNFEAINIFDVPQRRSLEELQAIYPFSLHKTLVTERAYYDYSSFRRSQCYSRLGEEQIAERITPFANAFDYVIREKADIIFEWFPDCFIPALSGKIAEYYGKPYRVPFQYYWWTDGAFFIDRPDITSSLIDSNYRHYYDNPELCDRKKLDNVFSIKRLVYAFTSSETYTFSMRVRQLLVRQKSYEPLSVRNWIVRRISKAWSATLIRTLIPTCLEPRDEPFVVYPIHVQPEASLLGPCPELADQFSLIKNISMNLPYGVKLYVKDHPSQDVGLGLDYDFYRRLLALPNVRFFPGPVSIDKLIDHPRFIAVTALAGTICLEAAIKRKPVFIFGKTVFAAADCFLKPTNFEDFYAQLISIQRGEFRFNERALYAMLNALDASIFHSDVVDFRAQSRTVNELVMVFPYIMQEYMESRIWQQRSDHAES